MTDRDIPSVETCSSTERIHQERAGSPETSCVSMKSDQSKSEPLLFNDGHPVSAEKIHPDSPEPSCVSMKSDQSKSEPLSFNDGPPPSGENLIHPDSPEPSCVSMKSDQSKSEPLLFNDGHPLSAEKIHPDSPEPSCVSMKSDQSKSEPLSFNDGHPPSEKSNLQDKSGVAIDPSAQEPQPDLNYIFMLLEEKIAAFVKSELKRIQKSLSSEYLETGMEDEEVGNRKKEKYTKSSREAFLKITLYFLRKMKEKELADSLQKSKDSFTIIHVCLKITAEMNIKFQCLFEGIAKAGNPTPLNQIYTPLYITEGETAEVNDEHEIRQIETASRKQDRPEMAIRCHDIFKASPGRDEPIRTVMTKGVAGIGKTVLTQKFTLDWAEDKANQDIHFTFPFTFRELNVLKKKKYSLMKLLHHFFSETKDVGTYSYDKPQVVFIFDGLDECRLPLNFHRNKILTDVTKSSTLDVLLTNLIRGNLLPSARIWITTRPAAANQIPPECVGMMTEVRGFNDPQKEEYFTKRFRDKKQASSIISHVKTSRSLHIMCHIPVFCWITATVLKDVLKRRQMGELPKTLTEMYIHFLVVQTKLKNIKYDGGSETDPHWNQDTMEMIVSLGKLAFEQLQKGNLIFYESDLTECGIDIRAASVYSGVFTQVFKEERGLYQDKVFCFVHLSVQEFLAALHVHLTFINSGVNLMCEVESKSKWTELFKDKLSNFYQNAVDKALQSPNGHLDLFLRFLLGLSLETNQRLLRGLSKGKQSSSQTNQKTVQYIKKKIRDNLSSERSINLFHCLNELNDHSLVEETLQSLRSGRLSPDKLSPGHWSALVFILLSSETDLNVFDLKQYFASEYTLQRLLPVLKSANKALLDECFLSKRSCEHLATVFSSQSCCVEELDLSHNDLQDLGVIQLCSGLESPHCRLEILRLVDCNLSEGSCGGLVSVLSSHSSRLRELDLSFNSLRDSGVKQLSVGLTSQHCRLKTLSLSYCELSGKSCGVLASVLMSNSSAPRVLDLGNNDLKDSGVKLLSDGLSSPDCRLNTLSLSGCQVTEEGCASLASAMSLNPSSLGELDLSYNHPGDSGKKMLSARLVDPMCGLKTLRMDNGGVHRLKPGLKKYACNLTLDRYTAHISLSVSKDNKKVAWITSKLRDTSHPERFNYWEQVLCSNGLTGRCYWEVQWEGSVTVGVTYKSIQRKGEVGSWLGGNNKSWSLSCSRKESSTWNNRETESYSAWHNNRSTETQISSLPVSNRVGVYLDPPAGTLSFFRLSEDGKRTHIHTFHCTFTEPLYPAFRLFSTGLRWCSVFLCEL
ncbi:NACHT, LRR and PYD domains-containing protein 3-like [Scomber scombrus]|uniref:NACHT, LRR and PYD domains-containing protein 3-like n=1 Tax=Scomber scombrus TaxID=13677 RepID=UPI002DDB068E|nr:NACHT, LRR and PYD domains-containing protein 3-like [Scomber scombrus]